MTRIPLHPEDRQTHTLDERLAMSTAEIGLSVRTTNCLEERGIFTVKDLLQCTRKDLLSISNFGEKTFTSIPKTADQRTQVLRVTAELCMLRYRDRCVEQNI